MVTEFFTSPAKALTVRIRNAVALALMGASMLFPARPALAEITSNPDGSRWASGKFYTYRSDGGRVDSTVTYYVHYWPRANGTATIDWVFVHESPSPRQKIWIQYCYATRCAATHQFLNASQFRSVQTNWNVTLQKRFVVKVTNSIDPSGIWGETWTGVVTLR